MKKLDPKDIENILALSPLQEGMLFHYLQDTHSEFYFEQLSLEISGLIDVPLFEKAWNIVIAANEMLRTVFRWEKLEKPSQIILKEHKCKMFFHDLSNRDSDQKQTALEEIKRKDRHETFDLQEVPFRVILCKLAEKKFEMIISNHHILYDGWSNGIILKEFFKAYHELNRGERSFKIPTKQSFKEFVKWFQNQDRNKQELFWKDYLAEFETPTQLLVKRKSENTTGVGQYSFIFTGDLKVNLDIFVKNHRVTLAPVLYSAWGILLQKYGAGEDVIFGTTVSGRGAAINGVEDVVGLFINTIPLRIKTSLSEKLIDVVLRTEKVLREREEFENTSLVDIGTHSGMGGGTSLFDTIMAVENYPLDNHLVPDGCLLSIDSYTMTEMPHYDLSVGIMLFNGIEIKFSFKPGLFEPETIENLARHFNGIVQNIVENPETALGQLEIISTAEKNRILYEFNNTAGAYPDKTIHQLFAEQAERTPDRIAVTGPMMEITYRQLNELSDRLAGLLIEKGVMADSIVGILMQRSVEMAVGILGILKANGAYLPIDAEFPGERIDYMLKNCDVKILLTDDEKKKMTNCQSLILNCELLMSTPTVPFHHSSFISHHSNHLAYVIYTSGTTGKPHGVLIDHRGLVNYTCWRIHAYGLTEQDITLELLSYSFDGFGSNFYSSLLSGGLLIMVPDSQKANDEYIRKIIKQAGVTNMSLVPGLYHALVEGAEEKDLESLRFVVLAGERAGKTLLDKSFEKNPRILHINEYGPTETTVTAIANPGMSRDNTAIIGKPITNTHIYIIDNAFKLVPTGVPGQLCIEGVGCARGYLNNPGLTAEKFKFNRYYGSYGSYNNACIFYKTGDLARWLNDGNIEYLGRIDQQVKIRGFRIELGEIEDCLLKHNDIKAAVVLAAENNTSLCTYIVLKDKESGSIEKMPDAAALKEFLSQRLPNYMIPSHFFLVEKIPLTANGKVDNKALLAANNPLSANVEYVSPQNDIEKTIVEIWKDLLNLEKVGTHDNFFDLGGNSLSLIRLNSRLKSALPDKKDISVVTLFNHPTIASLANYLNREEPNISSQNKPYLGNDSKKAIAVIGMAGRFPGAKDIDQFWANIKNGSESIHFFTNEELKELGVSDELINNPDYVPAKGVLENKEYFDSFFFGYTPSEAGILDPQVRLFHECTWAALENAGYDSFNYDGSIGLYAGASPNPLWEISPFTSGSLSYSETWNALQFSDKDYLSTRIAYKLDLKGPCVTVQTACSTSLVAVEHACSALVSGICTMAMAGGVSITFQDEGGYLYQEGTIMSPDGHCRAFDARAKGTVGGNGVGVVVLKRLADAEADGDNIYAVIKGFGINNDGKNKVGFTAPSSTGQARAIRNALDMAEINPETITYIETHGTGTPLGDPIEIEGLKLAFNSSKKHFCALGSVKTNIGHLDAAAGIAGLIKTTLSLYHGFIPPSLNFQSPNPQCDLENSPFYVNTELKPCQNHPFRASVSSFGLGGTNVHIILEEYAFGDQEPFYKKVPGPPKIFDRVILLSAQTPTALEKMSENLANYFEQNPDINLTDAAYTLQTGRKAFTHRKMLVCSDLNHAVGKLPDAETALAKEEKHTVIFMFSGQGSQYVNMGLNLYQNIPTFQHHIDECFSLLKNITGIDMKPILYPEKENVKEAEEKIFQFKYTTPIKFSFEYALAKTLISWGITPGAMIVHSFGEYAAACLAGVFSLEDGLFLSALRGELMHGLPDGAMLSVPLSEKELKQRLTNQSEIDIAAINTESLCIVSGPIEAINRFETKLNQEGHECLRLQVPKAGHSRMVEPIMAEFKQKISKVKLNKPQIPFISCVTGTWMKAEDAVNPAYWTQHLRKPVRFADGLTHLFKEPNPIFLQTTPGKGLILFINQHPDYKPGTPLTLSMVRHHKEPGSDVRHTFTQIGRLWLHGYDKINWPAFYQGEKTQRIPLPSYPFEPIHYPVNKNLFKSGTPVIPSFSPETGRRELSKKTNIADWFYVPSWEHKILPPNPDIHLHNQTILLFINNSQLELQLKKQLEQSSSDIITVQPGTNFKKSSQGNYTLDPADKEHYHELLKDLAHENQFPVRI
ncbi:MAG TPA: amino acid adenylation domain-containing protein, partial [Candidatus Deferrimicrobium sp.]|nr:amino acid adenylation domain-containing protein [Candidatus Deferrimicrobium sp.]